MTFDAATVRKDFPILDRTVNGKPLIYLDSSATTQKPNSVIDAISEYYRTINANVHRGAYTLADEATVAYEGARSTVAGFVNAGAASEIVFSHGTTSSINTVAYGWGLNRLQPGDRILLTVMEHHSNIVPWQIIARHTGAELVYLELDDDYGVDLDALDRLIDDRLAIVAVSGGMWPFEFGKPCVASPMQAMPTVVGLRPVSIAARDGEQSAVVWNWVYRSPISAIRSKVGVSTGPPKELNAENPTSSHTT